jgi:SAM-dependent methyltransferase
VGTLTNVEDAFGHLLEDYLRGRQAIELVERDDGLMGSAGSPRRYFAPFSAWPANERAAMAWAKGRVLDIGCGAGRHALYLQGRGMDVVGIDISPRAIEVCRRRGLRDARVLDITQLCADSGTWDTLLLLGANLGLLGSAEDARFLLARFAQLTGDGARLIAESRDPAVSDEQVHVAYQELNRQSLRLPGQLRLRIHYSNYATPWFNYLFVSKAELEGLLVGTAWHVVKYLDAETETGAYIALIEKASGTQIP